MCDGCTVISKRARDRVLDLILQDRVSLITKGRSVDPVAGAQLFDNRDFETLMGLMSHQRAHDVFRTVHETARDNGYIPPGMKLEFRSTPWSSKDDGGYTYEVLFVRDDSDD